MRERKFRVWDKINKKWIHPVWDVTNPFPTNQHHEIMQYTGLTDTNGEEIFEGDIVRDNWCDYIDDTYVVSLNEGAFMPLVYVREGYNCIDQYDKDRFEKIGNKCENPELLKNK